MEKCLKEKISVFLISFIAAVFIWLYVANMQNPMQTKTFSDVPINIVNLEGLEEQNLSVKSKSLEKLTVTVEGRFTELQKFDNSMINAELNLQDLILKEGKNLVTVDISSMNTNVKIIKEKTDVNVELQIEKIISKEFPIVLQTTGAVKNDYMMGEPIFPLPNIICSGTQEDINAIKQITASINLADESSEISTKVPLKVVNKNNEELKGVILKVKETDVKIPVYYKKEVPVELNITNGLSEGYKLTDKRLSVTKIQIYGEKSVLDKINIIKTEGIDLSRRYSDFDRLLPLAFPEGVKPVNATSISTYASFIIEKK